jgi:hypothetical protein
VRRGGTVAWQVLENTAAYEHPTALISAQKQAYRISAPVGPRNLKAGGLPAVRLGADDHDKAERSMNVC